MINSGMGTKFPLKELGRFINLYTKEFDVTVAFD